MAGEDGEMNYNKCRYKVSIKCGCMWYLLYGENMDEINANIDRVAKENKRTLEVEIYTHDDNRHPCLADWKLVEKRNVKWDD